jgi:hypothetical protein
MNLERSINLRTRKWDNLKIGKVLLRSNQKYSSMEQVLRRMIE